MVFSISPNTGSTDGYPIANVHLNDQTCKSYRGEVTQEAMWTDTILFKKGDIVKIIVSRAVLSYAKIYSL